jgi:hypothetical protein
MSVGADGPGRSSRLMPIAVLLLGLALVAGFMVVPFLGRSTPTLEGAVPVVFHDRFDMVAMETRVQLHVPLELHVEMDVTLEGRPLGGTSPSLLLQPGDHATAPLVPEVENLGEGRYRAVQSLPMPGVWELHLSAADLRSAFRVDVPE